MSLDLSFSMIEIFLLAFDGENRAFSFARDSIRRLVLVWGVDLLAITAYLQLRYMIL